MQLSPSVAFLHPLAGDGPTQRYPLYSYLPHLVLFYFQVFLAILQFFLFLANDLLLPLEVFTHWQGPEGSEEPCGRAVGKASSLTLDALLLV